MAMATAQSNPRAVARWQDFLQLLKPRVMSLVIFTALTGLVCAPDRINPILAAVAVLCIAVGAGASASLNMWYDADIDAKMRRTRGRPVPAGKVQGADALALGVVLSLFSVMLMGMALNWLAAGLLAFTIVFYAVVYTMWLKRWTAQNIVIGGLAGALPPVIGWAAATGGTPLNAQRADEAGAPAQQVERLRGPPRGGGLAVGARGGGDRQLLAGLVEEGRGDLAGGGLHRLERGDARVLERERVDVLLLDQAGGRPRGERRCDETAAVVGIARPGDERVAGLHGAAVRAQRAGDPGLEPAGRGGGGFEARERHVSSLGSGPRWPA